MGIAWESLTLLLVLMPGFAALFGFYSSSVLNGQLRDVTPKSRAGEMAMVAGLALGCHMVMAILYSGVAGIVGGSPNFGVQSLSAELAGLKEVTTVAILNLLGSHRLGALTLGGYVMTAALAGYGAGVMFIWAIERKWLPFEVRRFHGWTYDFVIPPDLFPDAAEAERALRKAERGRLTVCRILPWVGVAVRQWIKGPPRGNVVVRVLTKTTYDKGAWFVGYTGFLHRLHLDSDQNVKLVVLKDSSREFYRLHSDGGVPPQFSPLPPVDGSRSADLQVIPADMVQSLTRESPAREIRASSADMAELDSLLP